MPFSFLYKVYNNTHTQKIYLDIKLILKTIDKEWLNAKMFGMYYS